MQSRNHRSRGEDCIMNIKAVERIKAMEVILDTAIQKADNLEMAIRELEEYQEEIQKLEAYYTSDDWKDDFDIAYINGIRQIDTNDDNVIDETIMDVYRIEEGSLIPNTPYLIRAKTTGEKTISVNNATLYEAKETSIDCSTTISKYIFTGTYETIPASTLIENEYYAMGGGSVIMTDGESDLKPYRWYMKIEARNPIYNVANTPNAAKAITINVIDEEGEATGISQVSQNDKLTSRIYDLNGRVVNENALKPGIYIKNGKKFVIK